MEDVIGTIIFAGIALALLIVSGFGVLFSFELCSAAFSWLHLSPAVCWSIFGLAAGGTTGCIQGAALRGGKDNLRKIYAGAGILFLILTVAGAVSPAGRSLLGR